MKELSDGVSRKSRRTRLPVFLAVAFVALLALWPASGDARRACGDSITFYSSVVTDLPSIDCETAMTKAYRKALQVVENQRAAYVCPQACPVLVQVTAPIVTHYDCFVIFVPGGYQRYHGVANAQGTYICVE